MKDTKPTVQTARLAFQQNYLKYNIKYDLKMKSCDNQIPLK